jgi:hypothetical protein
MTLFDDPIVPERESTPVLEYVRKFLPFPDVRYQELSVNVVGEKTIASIKIVRKGKSTIWNVDSRKMAVILNIDEKGLIEHFAEKGSTVMGYSSKPPTLIRRAR